MTGLDRPALHTGRVHHLTQAHLADRAQLELVLKQRSQELATLSLQQILQLGVLKPIGLHALKRSHDRIEPLPRAGKHITSGSLAAHTSAITLKIRCIILTRRRARQEFIRLRVKFARTGAKVSGHCGHLSWSTLTGQRRPSAPSLSTPAARDHALSSVSNPRKPRPSRATPWLKRSKRAQKLCPEHPKPPTSRVIHRSGTSLQRSRTLN